MKVYLEMPKCATDALRARLGYAFRLFCAIYGHRPLFEPTGTADWDVAIRYRDASQNASISDARTIWLCRGLMERDVRRPAPPPVKYARNGLVTTLHYAPQNSKAPDWIGEIFEWVSCADEYSVTQRDRTGAPRFEATYAGRHNLDIRIPYAAIAMRALQLEICRVAPRLSERAPVPEGLLGNAVIPTHHVNYFPSCRAQAAIHLLRRATLSCFQQKQPGAALRHAAFAMQTAIRAGNHSLHKLIDQVVNVAERELTLGFKSSFYFQAQSDRLLDSDRSLAEPEVLEVMRWLKARGMEVRLRGSSLINRSHALAHEYNSRAKSGLHRFDGRRHQLRLLFDRLLPDVVPDLPYDSSIGWPDRIGFRAGACFAYPPYDFANERPAAFLEFPVVAMDEALRGPGRQPGAIFHEISQMIAASRRLGWGGISLMWHPAASASGRHAQEVSNVFWRLAEDRSRWNDVWLKASRFLELARGRFVTVGLLAPDTPLLTEQEYVFPAFAGSRTTASAQEVAVPDEAVSA